jgi:predicted transglutaminase-like cysteine proteinase
MSEIAFPKRTKAHKSVLRRATLPMAIVALAAGLAFPNAAMAKISQTAASDFCAERPVSFALANNIRVEPAAGPISFSKASAILGGAMSKLEQMRSFQASSASITPAVTSQKIVTSSDCNRNSATFAAPDMTATDVPKDAVLGAQSVVIARTPFDSDWAAIHRPDVASIQNAVAKSGARNAFDTYQQVQIVNRWINHNIAFGDDQIVYGRADYWASHFGFCVYVSLSGADVPFLPCSAMADTQHRFSLWYKMAVICRNLVDCRLWLFGHDNRLLAAKLFAGLNPNRHIACHSCLLLDAYPKHFQGKSAGGNGE